MHKYLGRVKGEGRRRRGEPSDHDVVQTPMKEKRKEGELERKGP